MNARIEAAILNSQQGRKQAVHPDECNPMVKRRSTIPVGEMLGFR